MVLDQYMISVDILSLGFGISKGEKKQPLTNRNTKEAVKIRVK